MPKTFYTERDIIDLADRGVTSLEVNDDVVLTDQARDLALKRGVRLIRARLRAGHAEDGGNAELVHRVKAAVIARLGDQVDAKLLDAVVTKVVNGLK
jgi:hypothetical protein